MQVNTKTEWENPLWGFSTEGEDTAYFGTLAECEEAMERCKKQAMTLFEEAKPIEITWYLCPYCGSPHRRLGFLNNHLRYCKAKPKDVPHDD